MTEIGTYATLLQVGPPPLFSGEIPPAAPPKTGGLVFPTMDPNGSLLLVDQWQLLDLLRQTGFLARLILLLLLGFSVASWAVMWERRRTFRSSETESEDLLALFHDEPNLTQVRSQVKDDNQAPLAALFRAGYHELQRASPSHGVSTDPAVGMRNIDRGLTRAMQAETVRLERGLGFLATTASATPFIGLFGTVWGIMNAFHGIGLTGTTSLGAVAPGIAEALINTAAGLAAAIPAVIGYNYFLARIGRMTVSMENFASEFAGEADRILHTRQKNSQNSGS